jgi:hypothetical protein
VSPVGRKAVAGGYYVIAGGRVWGPYLRDRIDGFVAEGRVSATTPVGEHPEGPFQPAGRHPALGGLFQAGGPAATASEAATAAGRERALVVWATLPQHRTEGFEQLLGAYGAWAALAPGLWVVRARQGPSALRNALTRRLTRDDALLVVEAPLDQAAWFNLGGGDEPALRRLWASVEPS